MLGETPPRAVGLLLARATKSGASVQERAVTAPIIASSTCSSAISVRARQRGRASRQKVIDLAPDDPIARWAGIVGGKKTGRTVTVVQLGQMRGDVLNLPFGFAPDRNARASSATSRT